MKLKDIIRRIDLQRKSRPNYLLLPLPYDNFIDKLSSARELLFFVEENTKDKKIRLEARKHAVIVCVSAMETYFKNVARAFIDRRWVADDFLSTLKDNKFTLSDLSEIGKEKISIGEIVSVSQSFQNLEMINRIYTKMFGVGDFILEVESFKVETEEEEFVLKGSYPDFRREIEEMIRLRHLIVHHEGVRRLGIERLGEMWRNLNAFVIAADSYILERVPVEGIDLDEIEIVEDAA